MSQKISDMTKLPTLTGATKIPTGEPGPGGNYMTDPDQLGVYDEQLIAVAIDTGVLTLPLDNRLKRCFYVDATISANFTLAVSSASNARVFTLDIVCDASIAIQFPSGFGMQLYEQTNGRWADSTGILTLVAGKYEFSITQAKGTFQVKCSDRYLIYTA